MEELSNCLLQGYGVLPSSPLALRISNVNPTFAILRWEAPKTLGKTVVSYNVRYRPTEMEDSSYKTINTKTIPYILEGLDISTEYEVYVSAVNEHGVGEPSTRVIFRTAVPQMEESVYDTAYNVTACCHTVGIGSSCMPLCDYSAKMSDLRLLTQTCTKDFPKLLRCGAGGRNHLECCERRGIPQACLGFCTGHVPDELFVTAAACLPYIGNVIQCFEEGTIDYNRLNSQTVPMTCLLKNEFLTNAVYFRNGLVTWTYSSASRHFHHGRKRDVDVATAC